MPETHTTNINGTYKGNLLSVQATKCQKWCTHDLDSRYEMFDGLRAMFS